MTRLEAVAAGMVRAIKRARLVRPALCAGCELATRQLEAHHYLGYERAHWLDVEWLCRWCHRARHARGETAEIVGMLAALARIDAEYENNVA